MYRMGGNRMTYALIIEKTNKVIGFIEQEDLPIVGDTPAGEKVIPVPLLNHNPDNIQAGMFYDSETEEFYHPEVIPIEQPEPEPQPYQPTNAEVAQMISDLQADLIIAGVI